MSWPSEVAAAGVRRLAIHSKGAKQITDIVKNAEAPKNQDKGRYPG